MKRWAKRLAAGVLLLGMVSAGAVRAFAEETEEPFILVEMNTGTVLREQGADQERPMASLTKIMGMILVGEALEQGKLSMEEKLTCSQWASHMGGSEIWLKEGEQMTVEELLRAVTIASANDAMVVLAERLGGTEEGFVKQMNEKARELGLTHTHFVNATGFDEEGHYTTARDVAAAARKLMDYPQVTQFSTVWMDELRNGKTQLVNTNRLVRYYEGTLGLKTGTTDGAGHCLCAVARRGDLLLCSVVMGCRTGQERFQRSMELLDEGFSQYALYRPQPPELADLKVERGMEETVPLRCPLPEGVVVKKEALSLVEQKAPEPKTVPAPVEKGQKLGELEILMEGRVLMTCPIEAAETVEKRTFARCVGLMWRHTAAMSRE